MKHDHELGNPLLIALAQMVQADQQHKEQLAADERARETERAQAAAEAAAARRAEEELKQQQQKDAAETQAKLKELESGLQVRAQTAEAAAAKKAEEAARLEEAVRKAADENKTILLKLEQAQKESEKNRTFLIAGAGLAALLLFMK